jgi:hypothetical protein
MATKKSGKNAATKTARKKASKGAAKTARRSAAKRAGKAVKMPTIFEVDLRPLVELRDNDLKPLAETPRALSPQEAGAFATKVHGIVAAFLKKCGGPGGGESPTKIRVVGSGN